MEIAQSVTVVVIGKPFFPLLLSTYAKLSWCMWIHVIHKILKAQLPGYAAHPEQQREPFLSLAKLLLTCICTWSTLSHFLVFFPGCCSPAGVMARLKASSLKATQYLSAPLWRTAGTPAQRGPGAASMASVGHGKATASSSMQERHLTPTETLLTVKGRTYHLIAFSWQVLVFPDSFKAWEHRRKPNSAAFHLGHAPPRF